MTQGTIKAATVDSNNRSGKSAADNSKIGYADIITPQGAEIKTGDGTTRSPMDEKRRELVRQIMSLTPAQLTEFIRLAKAQGIEL